MPRSIVLTGPMGSGKTSVGTRLAQRSGFAFVDLDARIVEVAGKSINEIFAQEGEAAFRQLEQQQLAALVGTERIVLSTGGGAVLRDANRQLMRQIGTVVNLTASQEELVARLEAANDRPLLQGEDPRAVTIARLVTEREPYYADCDIRIDTTGKSVEDIAAELMQRLSEGC